MVATSPQSEVYKSSLSRLQWDSVACSAAQLFLGVLVFRMSNRRRFHLTCFMATHSNSMVATSLPRNVGVFVYRTCYLLVHNRGLYHCATEIDNFCVKRTSTVKMNNFYVHVRCVTYTGVFAYKKFLQKFNLESGLTELHPFYVVLPKCYQGTWVSTQHSEEESHCTVISACAPFFRVLGSNLG
jgi:hypothetical protein